jgi:uncharacterized repeat protein (TIGR04076 family)
MKKNQICVKVTSTKGNCRANVKVGDTFIVSPIETGGLCGAAYHSIFPMIFALTCDGNSRQGDNPNKVETCCPDHKNLVTFEITRNIIEE